MPRNGASSAPVPVRWPMTSATRPVVFTVAAESLGSHVNLVRRQGWRRRALAYSLSPVGRMEQDA